MDDNLIYSYKEVSISKYHLIANGKKYSLDSILWVDQRMLKPNRWLARLLMFSGLPLLFGHAKLPLLGSVLMMLGLLHWRSAPIPYSVVIGTTSGEHQVLISVDSQHVHNLVSALNVAQQLSKIT
ncbi:DUF6232 family protein [Methylophilus luteus]|uniref:DUF6232 family protein n=1 Tax=Methylophilus luteus TaxID=640108 RepID=A0ABW3FAM8_9PROT